MTPQEISDYKYIWFPNCHSVRLHSDLDIDGKDWCRRNLERHQWSMSQYTNFYEHTFHFEDNEVAIEFSKQWPKFVNQ